jgi:protein-tyrosine phosphatase
VDQIIDGLWVGNRKDAQSLPDPRRSLCVLEVAKRGPTLPEQHWIPILEGWPNDCRANREALDKAADLIHAELAHGDFLVHCGIGVERSPLTVAWYLVKHHKEAYPDLNAAYAQIQSRRPIVQDRQKWLR